MLVHYRVVVIIVGVVAHRCSREERREVWQANEKFAISFVFSVHLRPGSHGPLGAVVTPIPRPLLHAKRISHFHEILLTQVVSLECLRADHGIRCIVIETVLLEV